MFATDDEMIGLVKMLAATTRTSDTCDMSWVPGCATEDDMDVGSVDPPWHVVVNGVRVGRVASVEAYEESFREARLVQLRQLAAARDRRGVFATAACTCTRRSECIELHISGDAGRLVRPLLVARPPYVPPADTEMEGADPVLPLSLTQLLCEGRVEYLDAMAIESDKVWIVEKEGVEEAGGVEPSHIEFHPVSHLLSKKDSCLSFLLSKKDSCLSFSLSSIFGCTSCEFVETFTARREATALKLAVERTKICILLKIFVCSDTC